MQLHVVPLDSVVPKKSYFLAAVDCSVLALISRIKVVIIVVLLDMCEAPVLLSCYDFLNKKQAV